MSLSNNTSPASVFWGRFDGIAVVNLDDRPDRWKQVSADAAVHLNGAPPLTRVPAVRGTNLDGFGARPWFRGKASDKRWAAKVGCTQSHRKVMEFARAQGWNTFLVLEDDADFTPLASADLAALDHALFVEHPGWDVCYLGFSKAAGTSLRLTQAGPHACAEMTGCYTTHAYLVRTRARDWILKRLATDAQAWAWHAKHRIIDRWYVRHLSRGLTVFAVTPSIITQAAGFSDIVQRQVDYAEEFTGCVTRFSCSPRGFFWRKKLSHISFALGDCYDAFRGLLKRLKGF